MSTNIENLRPTSLNFQTTVLSQSQMQYSFQMWRLLTFENFVCGSEQSSTNVVVRLCVCVCLNVFVAAAVVVDGVSVSALLMWQQMIHDMKTPQQCQVLASCLLARRRSRHLFPSTSSLYATTTTSYNGCNNVKRCHNNVETTSPPSQTSKVRAKIKKPERESSKCPPA